MPLAPGARLGPYEILAPIGAGGMGEVWKAHDPRLGRHVAIKVSAQQFNNRFEREARAIAALNHPNICQVHDVGPDYLVMEFIEGTPPRGPLAPSEALKIALGIAAGLEAAHDKGITHRDLKPENILITRSGVKLLDFGLALMNNESGWGQEETITAATMPGAVMGTAAYMSPEQAQGKTADARSDIFSFGLVLYELLSGKRPFTGTSMIEVMAAIVRDEPAPLNAPAKLSETVLRCLRKAPAARFQTMSEVRAALEGVTGEESAQSKDRGSTDADEAPSIAVLPFANLSGDREQEYFSDGLAEEILNLLAKISGLRVIARTSSFAFRGKEQDIRGIAETLGVKSILEGSVRRSGNRIRVTAQLIEAKTGSHLWSERFDRDLTDVFAVQDEIGQAISDALQVRLIARAHAVNVEAWQHWLKGVHHRGRTSPDAVTKAKEEFERALAIDPHYAQAYSGLALCYYVLAAMGARPFGELTPFATLMAEKALSIDPTDSDAHTVLGLISGVFNFDWERAGKHHLLCVTGENDSPLARFVYGMHFLLPRGRTIEATEQCRKALQSDPLSLLFHNGLVCCLFAAGQHGEAIASARQAIDIDPNYGITWIHLGFAQLGAGLYDEAIDSFTRAIQLAPWHHMSYGSLAAACWRAGDRERGRELAMRFPRGDSRNFSHAIYYATSGDADAMFEALESAYSKRDLYLPFLQYVAAFDPYRAGPRFQSLLTRMNLNIEIH
jgi:TolB-like protein/tetratricopeptide (TPR) repeat protein